MSQKLHCDFCDQVIVHGGRVSRTTRFVGSPLGAGGIADAGHNFMFDVRLLGDESLDVCLSCLIAAVSTSAPVAESPACT